MTLDRDKLLRGCEALGLHPTGTQVEKLIAYRALILKWNKVYNLTALRDPGAVLTHHLLDCLAVVRPLETRWDRAGALLDVGSGAGLPGAVIAIMRSDIDVTCLDAVAKKSAFVQQVAAELQTSNLRGLHARVETLAARYQLISSRAFSSLSDFVAGTFNLLAPDGIWLAMKGKNPSAEIEQLPATVDVFHVEQLRVPDLDAERCIVWMRKTAN